MVRSFHISFYIAASLGLHVLFVLAAIFLAGNMGGPIEITPVDIVNLPKEVLQNLPPLSMPVPRIPVPVPPSTAKQPAPPDETFPRIGHSPDISLPKTDPTYGSPDGSEKSKEHIDQSRLGTSHLGKGPLPFLSQADIDTLAKKGMPEAKPGDDSVTLDTGEFKFISYNRWLKVRVESVLRYPELAAVSGIQGTLYIKFDIMKDGSLGGLELLKSSGYKILDDEALRAIRASAPFQPLPEEWHMERYPIRAAVLFFLNEAYIR